MPSMAILLINLPSAGRKTMISDVIFIIFIINHLIKIKNIHPFSQQLYGSHTFCLSLNEVGNDGHLTSTMTLLI